MSKDLIVWDIYLKLFKLRHDIWFKNFISDQLLLLFWMCINLIIGFVLKYAFNISNGLVLSATVPNLFISMICVIRAYKLQNVLTKTSGVVESINNELNLLKNYNDLDIQNIYDEFKNLSEVKLPDIDFKV